MAEKNQIYKCNICGNIVEVIHPGDGTLACCGQEMELLREQTADSSTEKHVPYIEYSEGKYIVKVGQNTSHPMEEKHYIEWIELITDSKIYRKYLSPQESPEAMFNIPETKDVFAREFCNIHGLWTSKK